MCDAIWHVISCSGVATLQTAIHLLLTLSAVSVAQVVKVHWCPPTPSVLHDGETAAQGCQRLQWSAQFLQPLAPWAAVSAKQVVKVLWLYWLNYHGTTDGRMQQHWCVRPTSSVLLDGETAAQWCQWLQKLGTEKLENSWGCVSITNEISLSRHRKFNQKGVWTP